MGLFTPDIRLISNMYDKIRYLIAWRLVILIALISGLLSSIYVRLHFPTFIIYLIVFILSVITIFYIRKTRKFLFTYWIFTWTATILITYSLLNFDDTHHHPDLLWIIAIVFFSFIGMGKKWAIFFIIYHSISLSYFFIFKLNETQNVIQAMTLIQMIALSLEVIAGIIVISYLFFVYLHYKDFSEKELKKKNRELEIQKNLIEAKNRENTTLVKEIHHRVKNNLQIVVSLLRMQTSDQMDEKTKEQFAEAIGRVMAISLIHQKLYEEKNLSSIHFETYFNELIGEIQRLHEKPLKFNIEIDEKIEQIGLKTIVPLGLLINELITNTIKHTFNHAAGAEIALQFIHLDENTIELKYSDNGIWKDDTSEEPVQKFGIELITLLTEQMEGSYKRIDTNYHFTLKNIDH